MGRLSLVIEPGAGACVKALPGLQVHTLAADILQGLPLPPQVQRDGRLLFYPGCSIGHATLDGAVALLQAMGGAAGRHGALLIGVDPVKARRTLERAYDDDQGCTAAFNRNVLRHVNRVLGADFEPGQWRHVALWNDAHQRIEMHLEAVRPQQVAWDGGQRRFAAGERLLTEYSHKYGVAGFGRLLRRAGLTPHRVWTDERENFALVLAVP